MSTMTDSRMASVAAVEVLRAFENYTEQFNAITRRARGRFEVRDWHGAAQDAGERLALYRTVIDALVDTTSATLGERSEDRGLWASMKAVYSALIANRHDWEIAETFFNSLTRRIFTTVGVDQQIEFVDTDFREPPIAAHSTNFRTYSAWQNTAKLLAEVLHDAGFETRTANQGSSVGGQGLVSEGERETSSTPQNSQPSVLCPQSSVLHNGQPTTDNGQIHNKQRAAQVIEERLAELELDSNAAHVEMIAAPFFRNKAAYLVGRIVGGDGQIVPLVLALLHPEEGITLDAVLLHEDDVAVLFSFTRAYFRVECDRPHDLVWFLSTIVPRKRIAELYIAIGHNKHGKTELYRDLLHELAHGDEQFTIAPGVPGMVMLVFTLPSYDLVFKIIKDQFAAPKNSTRADVMAKYDLVFQHDRAGRLIDAQVFEHLAFSRRRFSPELLAALEQHAAQTTSVDEQTVVLRHLYIERRVTPLDMFVREALPLAARAAVEDYGQTIKDLAASNIFPGDMLLKNFGVTRHGRVVFYDYDELCSLTDCVFRAMPQASSYDEEMAAEPWFSVGERDIFPEELGRFLGLNGELREAFQRRHSDLFTTSFWHDMQARIRAGVLPDIFPYPPERRMRDEG